MENFVPLMPFSVVYSSLPSNYMEQPPLMIPNLNYSSNQFLVSSQNFETSFAQISLKCSQLLAQNQELKRKLQEATISSENSLQNQVQRRKIKRRKQIELDKKYACCYENCKKEYASVLALNLHIKIRHNGGTKKQREILANQIIMAQIRGQPAPPQKITLPQGFLQNYRKEHLSAFRIHHHQ